MSKPKLLLLDEPSLGLSPLIADHIFDCVQRFPSQGMSVLLVEQNTVAALRISHRGYVIQNGRIVEEGAAQQLAGNERIREMYLGR